ncbi:MAG: hypothetical protein QM756_02330 [Polyangiaceae bacterium]
MFIDDHVCSTLAYQSGEGASVGLFNVVDFAFPVVSDTQRRKAHLPIDVDLFEASSDEPTMSLAEMRGLTEWDPRHCKDLRKPRRWRHLILVSHVWNDPKCPQTSWSKVKERVEKWVRDHFASGRRNPRIKADTEEDFGVWVDYMMVPNKEHEDGKPCEECRRIKTRMIQRIGALLTLATVLPMDDSASHRGWILQELTLDAHGVTRFEHRDRVKLMARKVEFSAGGGVNDTDDGMMLRCHEFVRLGQMPRCWPAVSRALLERFREAGHTEESSGPAHAILIEYARTFDRECHRAKRLMVSLTQDMARAGYDPEKPRYGSSTDPISSSEFEQAVDEQGEAMSELASWIEGDDISPDLSASISSAMRSLGDLRYKLPPTMASELAPSFLAFREAVSKVPTTSSDPDWGLRLMRIEERRALTRLLQWQQLVASAMGLRAEWLQGAGLGAWVRSTALAEALGATKFTTRLQHGQRRFSVPSGLLTLEASLRPAAAHVAFARRVAREGVRVEDLRTLYEQ